MYYATSARCGPWLVGMTLGFIMYQNRDNTYRLTKNLSQTLWIVSISLLVGIIIGYFSFQQTENYFMIPNYVNALYNAFYRSSWAIAISFIIFACHNGSGGIIKWFLNLQVFKVIARMSLSIYLSHRFHQIINSASIRQPVHLNPANLIHLFFGDVLTSLMVGTIVFLTIEAPFATLESRLFRRRLLKK